MPDVTATSVILLIRRHLCILVTVLIVFAKITKLNKQILIQFIDVQIQFQSVLILPLASVNVAPFTNLLRILNLVARKLPKFGAILLLFDDIGKIFRTLDYFDLSVTYTIHV